jgi:hypothetical protein
MGSCSRLLLRVWTVTPLVLGSIEEETKDERGGDEDGERFLFPLFDDPVILDFFSHFFFLEKDFFFLRHFLYISGKNWDFF